MNKYKFIFYGIIIIYIRNLRSHVNVLSRLFIRIFTNISHTYLYYIIYVFCYIQSDSPRRSPPFFLNNAVIQNLIFEILNIFTNIQTIFSNCWDILYNLMRYLWRYKLLFFRKRTTLFYCKLLSRSFSPFEFCNKRFKIQKKIYVSPQEAPQNKNSKNLNLNIFIIKVKYGGKHALLITLCTYVNNTLIRK